jgi:hypothetical protein
MSTILESHCYDGERGPYPRVKRVAGFDLQVDSSRAWAHATDNDPERCSWHRVIHCDLTLPTTLLGAFSRRRFAERLAARLHR